MDEGANLFFPVDYADSRLKFRKIAQSVSRNVETGHWLVPSSQDSDLSVDHCYFPPLKSSDGTPKTLIVMTSGIHGLETYAGSAIQRYFLTHILPRLDRSKLGVFVVHAMNPFGFKYHRRGTEKHVNLNRNFSIHPDLYRLKSDTALELERRFIPRDPCRESKSALVKLLRASGSKLMIDDITLDHFIKTVCPGQFRDPRGLEFGGFEPEPQSRELMKWLKAKMPEYRDILLLDLHTGLGHSGGLHLLTSGDEKEVHKDLFKELFKTDEDREFYEFTPATDDGFYETHGALNSVFPEIATPDQRVVAITMEFGTLGHDGEARIESLDRWMIEHQGLHYGFSHPQIESEAREKYLRLFYPDSDHWRSEVLRRASGLFERVLARLGALRSS